MSVWGSSKVSAEEPLSRLNRVDHAAAAVVVDTEQARSHLGPPSEAERPAATEPVPALHGTETREDDRLARASMHPEPGDAWGRTEEIAQAIVSLGDIRRGIGATSTDRVARQIIKALDVEFRLIRHCLADQIGDQQGQADMPSGERDRALERITWILGALDDAGGSPSPALARIIRALDPPVAPP